MRIAGRNGVNKGPAGVANFFLRWLFRDSLGSSHGVEKDSRSLREGLEGLGNSESELAKYC